MKQGIWDLGEGGGRHLLPFWLQRSGLTEFPALSLGSVSSLICEVSMVTGHKPFSLQLQPPRPPALQPPQEAIQAYSQDRAQAQVQKESGPAWGETRPLQDDPGQ